MNEASNKGICRLSVVPIRAEASDKAEMTSQLLFGEHYSVIETSSDGKWCKINTYFDDYKGWIDILQHYPISEEFFDQINKSEYKISIELFSSILFKKSKLQIVMGSVLPMATNELFKMDEQLAFNGESKSLGVKRDFEFLKEMALKYLNTPYLWGGKSPIGIDCSGFTQILFKICGYKLKRDASEQEKQGVPVKDVGESIPGDLAFFSNENGTVNHTGIVLEDRKIIHVSGKVRIDTLDDQGIFVESLNNYSHNLYLIKRIL